MMAMSLPGEFGQNNAVRHVWSATDMLDDSGNKALAENDNYFN